MFASLKKLFCAKPANMTSCHSGDDASNDETLVAKENFAGDELRNLAMPMSKTLVETVQALSLYTECEHGHNFAGWWGWWSVFCDGANLLDEFSHKCKFKASCTLAVDLPTTGPRWPSSPSQKVLHPSDGTVIPCGDIFAWQNALQDYGGNGGQQDAPLNRNDEHHMHVITSKTRTTLVREKRAHPPHRMSALWYSTEKYKSVFAVAAADAEKKSGNTQMIPTSMALWEKIAVDRVQHRDEPWPLPLSGDGLTAYIGELASTSLLLAHFPERYCDLVEQIYEDGRNARWTFGWSGLLSCYSKLWTLQRVFIAALNGLSLLALNSADSDGKIDPCVRAMLVGYTSFVVSDRAVGKRIARERTKELELRYRLNKGKTCRGSGVNATRRACKILGIPAEASYMDGLPAFSTGWAMEFMEAKPGCQKPEHGATHEEIEEREGSSAEWRYPY